MNGPLTNIRSQRILRICMIPLLYNFFSSMTGSIAVLYALDLKASLLQVNLITTIGSAMTVLLDVPFGILSDRFGRKTMLVIPRIVMLVSAFIQVFATEANHLILAACIGGFSGGSFAPLVVSMITDVVEPRDRRGAIGFLYLFSSVGLVTGPAFCSFLLNNLISDLRNVYQIDAISQIIILIFVITQIKETNPQLSRTRFQGFRAYFGRALTQRGIRPLLLTSFFFYFYFSIMNTYIPIYARKDLNLTSSEIASFSAYRNLTVMLVRLLTVTIFQSLPSETYLLAMLAMGSAAGFLASQVKSYSTLVLVQLLFGASFGATSILSSSLVADATTSENRGVINSLNNFSQSVGRISQILTSSVAENQGLATVFVMGGVSAIVSTLPTILLVLRARRKEEI